MNNQKFLLNDEKKINIKDYIERKRIYNIFCELPVEFFSKLRHFQPQIGCLNACSFCSKSAISMIEYWNESRIRNVIAALKLSAQKYKKEKPYIVWDRNEHRNEVIFSYSDNDIGNYKYLDKFIKIVYDELGVKTRISTVGYSRLNEQLNKIHTFLANNDKYLGGVRLSFTPYAIGWCSKDNKFSREDYIKDISNFLKIYKPYYNKVGSGCRKMCVEIRYKPLVKLKKVIIGKYMQYTYIYTDKYLYVSKERNISFSIANINDPLAHSIKLSEKPIKFYHIYLKNELNNIEEYLKNEFNKDNCNIVDVYMMKNEDGIYYSIEPCMKENGNYGINIYPITTKRNIDGYIITERFFINTLIKYKKQFGLLKSDIFNSATWDDVKNVIKDMYELSNNYKKSNNYGKANYITDNIISLIEPYAQALQDAGYEAKTFFDPKFTIDTGIICNMGRAKKEFMGLTTKSNNPMTPTHERNYGKTNSTMVVENIAWKLNCGYDDTIIIEKLNLCNTATESGQVVYKKYIKLNEKNEKLATKNLEREYLVPGQRSIE